MVLYNMNGSKETLLKNMTLEELKNNGISGDEDCIIELGQRFLELPFCHFENNYCEHREKLLQLECDLENEGPPECPHCHEIILD